MRVAACLTICSKSNAAVLHYSGAQATTIAVLLVAELLPGKSYASNTSI